MNPNLSRALLLYQQSRFDMAEEALRQSLAVEPDHAYAHALLALCLTKREQFKAATEEAQRAVHLEPDFPFAHYALATVLHDRNHLPEALAAIHEALRLDSSDADFFALLSVLELDNQKWAAALEAAERGLQLESEHVGCTNLRAIALVKLGRKAEAGATIREALSKNPENAVTHANQGWTLLNQNKPKEALEHFREALRLDPDNDWARQGIVEALKAKNIIYALMLRYFLWMSRLSTRAQWGVILGGYFGNQLLMSLASTNPALAPWILPVRILYVAFAVMTWIAYPLFNLLLRANRFGRLVLSEEQMVSTSWFGWCLMLCLLSLAAWLVFDFATWLFISAIVFGLLLLPLSGTFRCPQGWPRNAMAGYTGLLFLVGLAAAMTRFMGRDDLRGSAASASRTLVTAFCLGIFVSGWVVNILISRRYRR